MEQPTSFQGYGFWPTNETFKHGRTSEHGVLHRPVGTLEVMAAQLTRLAEVSEQAHVTLQVIPYRTARMPRGSSRNAAAWLIARSS